MAGLAKKIERKHIVVAGSLITQFMVIGSVFAYGVFFKELEAEFGWSRTLLSGVSSLSMIVMGVLAIFCGRISDRFGPRWVLTASGLSFGIGYALMAAMNAPWQLFVLYGLLIGVGLSTHDVVTLSTVARWFPDKRGQLTGIVKVGTACGQIAMPLVAAGLIASFGWRAACVAIGIACAILLVLAAQGMRAKPPQPQTSRQREQQAAVQITHGLSFQQTVRTRQFWTICALQFLFFPILTTVPLHIVPHGTDLGMPAALAASVLSAIGAISIVGRLTIGPAIDRIGGRQGYMICFALLLVGLLLLRFTDSPGLLFLFACFYGVGHGGCFTIVSPTIAEYFGMKAHGAAFGVVIFFGTIGGALGPLLAGRSFDTTGSYNLAFSILAAFAMTGFLMALTLTPLSLRKKLVD